MAAGGAVVRRAPLKGRRKSVRIAFGMLQDKVAADRASGKRLSGTPTGGDSWITCLSLAASIVLHVGIAIVLAWIAGRTAPLSSFEPEAVTLVFQPPPVASAQVSEPVPSEPVQEPDAVTAPPDLPPEPPVEPEQPRP